MSIVTVGDFIEVETTNFYVGGNKTTKILIKKSEICAIEELFESKKTTIHIRGESFDCDNTFEELSSFITQR